MRSLASKVSRMAASFYSWWVGVWQAKGVTISFTLFALMALSGGMSVASQELTTGSVDLKTAAKGALVGALSGGLGCRLRGFHCNKNGWKDIETRR